MSAVALYPALHGLETGRRYDYPVYDSQSQRLAPVRQEIGAFERSTLFQGQAFRVETRLHGHRTRTWIDTRGRALFEMALNGVLLSRLETEREAKRYLALASLNKQDALLDFSRVALDRPLPGARELEYLEVALDGLDAAGLPPADARQRCVPRDAGAVCTLRRTTAPADGADLAPWLATTLAVPTADPRIQALAREIAADAAAPKERIGRLLAWLRANIRQEPVDAFSALDVLETRRAECQGHAYLYAALARALGIPTRVVNGLVYAPELQGFLYHSWTESLVDGRWHAVDPTFGQFDADATHIKLVEGETLGDLLPLVDVMGQVRARLLARVPAGGE
jgi:transglutaminase-like putative cysteine protease